MTILYEYPSMKIHSRIGLDRGHTFNKTSYIAGFIVYKNHLPKTVSLTP